MKPYKTYFNWSSGKDSALALYKILQDKNFNVDQLVTTVNSELNRVSMHGLRSELLERQTASIGLPLHKIKLHGNVSMSGYDTIMRTESERLVKDGYTHGVFGDIFLEDLRTYRDNRLAEAGLKGVYPLWKHNTKELIQQFIDLGFKAITVSVNARLLDESFVGRVIDEQFVNDLPSNVDPCGENGEFHTFVFDGPIFREPVSFGIGEKVLRTYQPVKDEDDNCFSDDQKNWDTAFWYCDLTDRDL